MKPSLEAAARAMHSAIHPDLPWDEMSWDHREMLEQMAEAAAVVHAAQIEAQLRPLVDKGKYDGGYDCCGCPTYDWIIDDAVAIVLGNERPQR